MVIGKLLSFLKGVINWWSEVRKLICLLLDSV